MVEEIQERATDYPPELSVGSSGIWVLKLQQNLFARGFLKESDIDQKFGRHTRNAVECFQRVENLEDTGIVDRATAAKLGLV